MSHPSQGVNNKVALQSYKSAISRYFRSTLALKAVSYAQLSERLGEQGIVLTPENLRNKVARGLVPADLFIVLLDILGESGSPVEPIIELAKNIQADK